MAWLQFELTYFDVVVQHVCQYTKKTVPVFVHFYMVLSNVNNFKQMIYLTCW